MKTEIYSAQPLLSLEDLSIVAGLLQEGRVVAIPTETVYGLAADLFCESAIREIFHVKGRASDNPLIAHVSDLGQVERIAARPSKLFYQLTERFWPGPLTLVTERKAEVPPIAAANLSTIAVRMPSHVCTRQIIDAVGSPLAAPSANRSGTPSSTSVQDVLDDFFERIPAVVDGGISPLGIESTVVGLFGDRPLLLRPGAIPREVLEEEIGMALGKPEGAARSPGMKYRHYAPKAKVLLLESERKIEDAYIPSDLSIQNLYAHFRKADRLGHSVIAIVLTPKVLACEALMDRILRAEKGI